MTNERISHQLIVQKSEETFPFHLFLFGFFNCSLNSSLFSDDEDMSDDSEEFTSAADVRCES